jgi:hypothetical protein
LIEGSMRVSCEDFHFCMRYSSGIGVVDFPSLGMLTKAAKIAKDFGALLAELPPLPPAPVLSGGIREKSKSLEKLEFLVAVNSRPIGRLSFETDKPKFIPTPLRFFKKVRDRADSL